MEALAIIAILALSTLLYVIQLRRRADACAVEAATLHAVVADLGEGVVVADKSGRFLQCNAAAERFLGVKKTRVAPDDWSSAFGLLDPATTQPFPVEELPLSRALRGEVVEPTELLVVNARVRDGVYLSATARPLLDKNGDARAAIVVFHDVTERKKSDEELKRAHAKLTASLDEIRIHDQQMTLLNGMTETLQLCQSMGEACVTISHAAERLFPGHSGAVCTIGESRAVVESIATWGANVVERVFSPKECWALRRGKSHYISERSSDLVCTHVDFEHAHACIPMVAQSETLGIVHLKLAPGAVFDGALKRLVATFTEDVALALGNLKLRESLRSQAIRDPLTGLFNRRFMEESLDRELRRAARRQLSLSVVMLDLDHFKLFNDRFGHAAGDTVLRRFGELLRQNVRVEDVVCRWGGEEFVLILPESSLEDTQRRVDQIRERVRNLRLEHLGALLGTITVSSGVAVFPQHGQTAETLLRAADEALFGAKAEGRDRVHAATPARGIRPVESAH